MLILVIRENPLYLILYIPLEHGGTLHRYIYTFFICSVVSHHVLVIVILLHNSLIIKIKNLFIFLFKFFFSLLVHCFIILIRPNNYKKKLHCNLQAVI